MADRYLVWFHEGEVRGDEARTGPTYYLGKDYTATAVRIYAETAPTTGDAEFDIRVIIGDTDVSLFGNRTPTTISRSGREDLVYINTSAMLSKTDKSNEMAEDFSGNVVLEEGAWVYCKPVNGGHGRNFTIQLELNQVSDGDETGDD